MGRLTPLDRPAHIAGKNYASGCRCEDCTAYATRRRKITRINAEQRARGRIFPTDIISAQPYHELVRRAIRERGVSRRELARITGVSSHTIMRLAKPWYPESRVTRHTASLLQRHIIGMEERAQLPGSLVTRKLSRQIVRSLAAQGWTATHLEYIYDNNNNVVTNKSGFIRHIMRTDVELTHKETEDRLLWLADNIGNREGPSDILKKRMQNQGHFPWRHYNVNGDLIESTLSAEQKAILKNVRS